MPVVGNKNQVGITLVRQDATQDANATQGKVVDTCKSEDTTPAPTPQLRRAIAFDIAKDGSTVVPNPPPPSNPPIPRRDPVLIELGNIELNAKLQFISLSDDPAATFDSGKVYELPITGYDENNRIATITLNADMMKEKGIDPGERLVLRQLDSNGNASDGIFVHLDPRGWANQQINQPDGHGGQQTVRGAQIQYQVGLHGVEGANQLGADPAKIAQTRTLLGVEVRDTSAPRIVEKNVKVLTTEWTKQEKEIASHLVNGPGVWQTIQNTFGQSLKMDHINQALASPSSYNLDAKTFSFFQALKDNPEMFKRFDGAANGPSTVDGVIGLVDLQEIANNTRTTFVSFDMAVEPGARGTIRNNRTGNQVSFQLADNQRTLAVKVPGLENGDKLVIEYRDANGNAGKPLDFEYSAKAKDGKRVMNPLLAQIGAMVDDPLAKVLTVSGREVKQVPAAVVGGAFGDGWIAKTKDGPVAIINGFAGQYEANADKLGLPLSAETATATGAEQLFEHGKMTWDRAANQVKVEIT